jgi:hypothetical protein
VEARRQANEVISALAQLAVAPSIEADIYGEYSDSTRQPFSE